MVMYEFVHKDFEMLSQLERVETELVCNRGKLPKFRLLSEIQKPSVGLFKTN